MTQKQRYNSRKIAMIVLLLLLFIKLEAQQATWEYVLRTPEIDEESIDLIEGNDGSIFVGGRTIMLEQQYNYKSLLLKIDPQGTFLDSVHFTIPGKWTSMSQILPVSNDNYVVLSTFRDLNPPHKNCGLHMQLMNGNLEITNQITILSDSSYRLNGSWGCYSVYDGNLFINLSVILQVGFYHSYLFELDPNFNIIKQKFLSDFPKAYSHLKKIDDNTYWALNLYTNKYEIFDSA